MKYIVNIDWTVDGIKFVGYITLYCDPLCRKIKFMLLIAIRKPII